MSVTEADRSVPPAVFCLPDCLLRALPSVSSTDSKSADLGRCFRRVRKSMALLSILNGLRRPEQKNLLTCCFSKNQLFP
jgi:hypothetical protein